jgi:hypothetical protein
VAVAAVIATPRTLPIALRSAPVTRTPILLLFLYGTVAVIFIVALLAAVLINVFLAVRPWNTE